MGARSRAGVHNPPPPRTPSPWKNFLPGNQSLGTAALQHRALPTGWRGGEGAEFLLGVCSCAAQAPNQGARPNISARGPLLPSWIKCHAWLLHPDTEHRCRLSRFLSQEELWSERLGARPLHTVPWEQVRLD